MKFSFPLCAKILLWFFLNLALLAALAWGFFSLQLHAGFDLLLAGQIGSRMEVISRVLEDELKETPRGEWGPVMERFNRAYDGVEFFLFRPDATQRAGTPVELPLEVQKRFPAFRTRLSLPVLKTPTPPRATPPPAPPKRPPGEVAVRPSHTKFMLSTENPLRYWVGVRLYVARNGPMPQEQVVLLAVSETVTGGGLFFEMAPWLKVGAGAVALSILLWLPLVRGMTRSISQITRATQAVAQGNFDVRVDAERRDELGRLGQAINAMAERLAGFVSGQKRFLGDTAHELCSPLARIELALSLLEAKAGPELQPRIADVREEAVEMASLTNEILAFSKASLGAEAKKQLVPVEMAEVVRRAVAREASGRDCVEVEVPEGLQVLADPGLLARAVANLVRNAIRYAGDAGPIVARAEARENRAVLTVTDSGPGVPEETLARLFDPFYRLDSSRSRETGGFGLGLAIVKTCVETCNGSVVARNVQPTGLQVEITLGRG